MAWYDLSKSVAVHAANAGISERAFMARAKKLGLPGRNALATEADARPSVLDERIAQVKSEIEQRPEPEPLPEDFCNPEVIKHLKQQNSTLMRDLRRERIKTLRIADACVDAISQYKIKPVCAPRSCHKPDELNLEMHVLRSDAQVGEKIEPALTSGLGNYSYELYLKRLDRLTDRVLTFWEQDCNSLGLTKLVSPQLGDQVEGEGIYRGQAFYIDRPLVDQLFGSVFEEINRFWLPLSQVFTEIEIPCVMGNHGRVGRKGDSHEKTNWDYVYYRCLKQALEMAAPHVKVHVSESPMMLMEHGRFRFMYGHGDDVQGWNGIPYYGLNRKAWKANSLVNMMIHYHLIGHFHVPSSLGDSLIINGTLAGGSNLSINKMHVTSVPSQTMFYLDKEHGINRTSVLYLDEPPKLSPDENGIYTPVFTEGET